MTQLMYGTLLDVAMLQNAMQANHGYSIGMLSYIAAQKPSVMLNVAAYATRIPPAD